MIGMKKKLLTLTSMLLILSYANGQLKINEILANNQGAFKNSTVQLNDWIELYNTSNEEVDLSGWGISDNDSIKHIFPNAGLKIPSKGYIVLVASGNKSLGNRHLSFSLNHDGETIKLFSTTGKVVDKLEYAAIRKDVAFGRKFDGSTRLRYFAVPNPGTSNNDQIASKKITKAPKFSKNGGFQSPFSLKISRFLSNADIFYTLDGSEPVPQDSLKVIYEYKKNYQENPGDPVVNQKFSASKNSFLYKGKITISETELGANKYSLIPTTFARSASYLPKTNIPKAQIVRAIAVKKGKLPSEIVSNTYFHETSKKSPYTLPIISLAFNPDDLFDYEKGMYVAGNTFDAFRRTSFETTGLCTVGNYSNRSSFWEKDASFELFEDSKQKICQSITARIHGGCSRSFPYKSFKLFSDDNFDKYDLIRKEKTKSQTSVVLRNSGNDYNRTLFKDVFIHQLMKPLNIPIQEFRPSIVYINGEYWGIHNLRDRVDNDYLENVYDVDKNNVDMIKIVFDGPEEIEYGDDKAYNELKSFFKSNGFSSAENFEKAKSLMDMANFIDYQIAHIFVGNIDWPQNNVRLWRVKTSENNKAPKDGKWRWVFFDADRSLGETVNVTHNNLSDAINRPENFIFNKLLQNPSFKTQFVTRFRQLLDSTFKYENSSKLYLDIKKIYEPEIETHVKRWNIISSKAQWERNCEEVLSYLKFRPDIVKKQLGEQLGLEMNEVQILNPMSAEIVVNDETQNTSVSKYIERNKTLRIKPLQSDNKTFSHWIIGNNTFYETEMEVQVISDTTILAVFQPKEDFTAEKHAVIESDLYTISQGISPNNDGLNEFLGLELKNQTDDLEQFQVFDKNGVEKFVTWEGNPENGKIDIQFKDKNRLSAGTLFYILKLKNNPKIYADFITVNF
jgi:hypothetical protein